MQVFILTDMEGVSGVKGAPDRAGNDVLNPDASTRLLVREVNAAAKGLVAAGADEVVLWEGHGFSNAFDFDELHPSVSLYQAVEPLRPIVPFGRDCAAFVQIGAHAMASSERGYLNHSFSSHGVSDLLLNGELIGEIGVHALLAAHFNVPTILVSGDRAACDEAKALLGEVATVETKVALYHYAAINHHPQRVRADLTVAAEKALQRRAEFPLLKPEPPYELRQRLRGENYADALEKTGAERIDRFTVAWRSDNLVDLWAQRNGWAPDAYARRFPIA